MEKFRLEENGYNRQDVNNFVSTVLQQIKELISKIEKQQVQLDYYKNLEDTVKNAIINAEKTGNDIRNEALKESEKIIAEAKQNASSIINETLLKSEKLELESEVLKKNINLTKSKLKLFLESQLALLTELENIEDHKE